MTTSNNNAAALRSQPFTIRYDATTVANTTEVVLAASDEQLVLECSSGLVAAGDMPTLPIHSRLSMTWTAAARLHELLGKALAGQASRNAVQGYDTHAAELASPSRRAARLPRFEPCHD